MVHGNDHITLLLSKPTNQTFIQGRLLFEAQPVLHHVFMISMYSNEM